VAAVVVAVVRFAVRRELFTTVIWVVFRVLMRNALMTSALAGGLPHRATYLPD